MQWNREMLFARLLSLVRNAAILLFPQHICQILQIFPLKIASFSNPWEKYRKEMKNFKCDLNCPQPGNVHFVTLREKAQL